VSNQLLYARQGILIPGGTSDNSVCVLDVSPYWEIRGFFAQRDGDITLTLQALAPNNPGAEPSSSNGKIIGVLDEFTLQGDFTRTYSTPGIWLEVLASSGRGGGARIGQLSFVGRT
jgi:hypothetical protein